jgi:hypothetical protein
MHKVCKWISRSSVWDSRIHNFSVSFAAFLWSSQSELNMKRFQWELRNYSVVGFCNHVWLAPCFKYVVFLASTSFTTQPKQSPRFPDVTSQLAVVFLGILKTWNALLWEPKSHNILGGGEILSNGILLTWQHTNGWELPRYITYLIVAFWHFCSSLLPFHTVQVTGWLNLITHILVCPITLKLGAPVQSVISDNQLKHAGYLE